MIYHLSFYVECNIPLTCLRCSVQFLPVAASVTVSLPATIFSTVVWISEKSLNVVKETFSLSQ